MSETKTDLNRSEQGEGHTAKPTLGAATIEHLQVALANMPGMHLSGLLDPEIIKGIADLYLFHPKNEPKYDIIDAVREDILNRDYVDGHVEFGYTEQKVDMVEFLTAISSKYISFDEMGFIKKLCNRLSIDSAKFLGEPKELDRILEGIPIERKLTKEEYDELISSTR